MPTTDLLQTLQLTHGECFAARGRAVRLTVVSGRLWFTRSGDLRDHFLHAGEHCVLDGLGALASAEGPTCVHVEAMRRGRLAPLARRWLQRLARAAAPRVAKSADGIIDRCPNAATS